jgi:ERCC4-related helicase
MHGKLHSDEKDQVMREFSANQCQVLVSTTVVEVRWILSSPDLFHQNGASRASGRHSISRGKRQKACFSANQCQVLVSTTVVEVGVNVPNATIMVIYDADLHQADIPFPAVNVRKHVIYVNRILYIQFIRLFNEVMREFSANQCQVLVSTTVVEVGVNVPNATIMVIYEWSFPCIRPTFHFPR